MRVLLLATPLDARAHLDGTRRAVVELAGALGALGVRPLVLVRAGVDAPEASEGVAVEGTGVVGLLAACVRARPTVVHALFAPRRRTGLVLAALGASLRAGVVQTIASSPPGARKLRFPTLSGDVVVATSRWMDELLARRGWDARRRALIPMPFLPSGDVAADRSLPRDTFLHVGDWEDARGIDEALDAFAQMAPPIGVTPHLAFAARRKTARSLEKEATVRARIENDATLRGRVRILGELPSLLPALAAARCVLLPATTTEAKLDHPRALLEAIALGTRIVVGAAPSLAELVPSSSLGEVAIGTGALREAMERAFFEPNSAPDDALAILAPRRPAVVAAAYARLYERVARSPFQQTGPDS